MKTLNSYIAWRPLFINQTARIALNVLEKSSRVRSNYFNFPPAIFLLKAFPPRHKRNWQRSSFLPSSQKRTLSRTEKQGAIDNWAEQSKNFACQGKKKTGKKIFGRGKQLVSRGEEKRFKRRKIFWRRYMCQWMDGKTYFANLVVLDTQNRDMPVKEIIG